MPHKTDVTATYSFLVCDGAKEGQASAILEYVDGGESARVHGECERSKLSTVASPGSQQLSTVQRLGERGRGGREGRMDRERG